MPRVNANLAVGATAAAGLTPCQAPAEARTFSSKALIVLLLQEIFSIGPRACVYSIHTQFTISSPASVVPAVTACAGRVSPGMAAMASVTEQQDKQEFSFQAEIKQLLHSALAFALPEPRDRDPRAGLERLGRARQDALHRPDRRVAARHRAARDRGRGAEGRPSTDHPRQRDRDDPRGAGGEPGHDRAQRVARLPQAERGGRVDGRAAAVADRPVRRRVLLGVHDRRQRAGADPELQGRAGGLGVVVRRLGDVHRDARRGRGTRHRGHPPAQGRRPRSSSTSGGSRRRCGSIRASCRTRSRSAARSSTTRSRSGSSPRAR